MRIERIKIAVLLDRPAGLQASGRNIQWEKLAQAAAKSRLPLDMTLYRYGKPQTIVLAPHARLLHLPPPQGKGQYPQLARHLDSFDIVHAVNTARPFADTALARRRDCGFALLHHADAALPALEAAEARQAIAASRGHNGHAHALLHVPRLPERRAWRAIRLQRRSLRRCDYALAMTPADHDLAVAMAGESRAGFLRAGVDKEIFRPDRRCRITLTQHFHIPPERMIILLAGRLEPIRGIGLLLDALATLIGMGHRPHLLAAGSGSMDAVIKDRLGDHATLCGPCLPEDMGVFHAGADILAIPSSLGHGRLSLAEAMASGLPALLAADSPLAGLPCMANAVQAVESSAPDWSATLHRLLTQPESLARMQSAAMIFALENRIPDWNAVLREDLFPAWQKALSWRRPVPLDQRVAA